MSDKLWPPSKISLNPNKRVLFLTKDLDLINNEINLIEENDSSGNGTVAHDVCIEALTLEQLNTNMITKFNQQVKLLDITKTKLIKRNSELENDISGWISLIDHITNLNKMSRIKHK